MFNPTMDDSLPPSLIAPFDLFLEVVIQKSEALGKPHDWHIPKYKAIGILKKPSGIPGKGMDKGTGNGTGKLPTKLS